MGCVTPLRLEPVRFAVVVSVRGIDEDPVAFAYGEVAVATVMYGEIPDRGIRLAPQQGQHAHAVLALVLPQVGTGEFRARGHEIAQDGELVADRPGGRDARPPGEEGHAVSAFPGIALDAAQVPHAVVAVDPRVLVAAAVRGGGAFRTVVAREDEQGVVGDFAPVQSRHDLAHHPVHFAHEVAVASRAAPADERRVGHDGRVGRGEGEVQEEGIGTGRFDVVDHAADERGDHLLEGPAGFHDAGPSEHLAGFGYGRIPGEAVLFEPGVGREIRHVHAEIRVESAVHRPPAHGTSEVDVSFPFLPQLPVQPSHRRALVGGLPVEGGPLPTQVPFAYTRGAVTLPAKQLRRGEASGLDQGRIVRPQDAVFQRSAPAVAAGQQGVAARRAHARRGVGVGETHAALGEHVQVGRRDLRIGVVAPHVAVPHVVREDVDDVGRGCGHGKVSTLIRYAHAGVLMDMLTGCTRFCRTWSRSR